MRIERLLKRKCIKEHIFLPSNRRIYTIISNEEYWIEPNINFCSCKGYYFKHSKICNHLKLVALASESMIDRIEFLDEEYEPFLYALVKDLTRYAIRHLNN